MKKTIQRAKKHLDLLSAHLDGTITTDQGVFTLDVGEHVGTGQVKCVCFNKCMTALEFDVNLFKDVEIPLYVPKSESIYFLYCLEGGSTLYTENREGSLNIEQFRTTVLHSADDNEGSILIKKDARLILNIIGIDKTRYQEEFCGDFHGLEGKLKHLLDMFGKESKTLHIGMYNLKIGEHVKQLHSHGMGNDISSFLHFEGLSNIILANHIDQFFSDLEGYSNTTQLNNREVRQIKELSDFIRNYPEIQHSIKSLCSRSGLSPNKLQEGFKFMHNRTVSDYIRNVRIERAEHLIKTTDMNISEVVYSIGLTSRSYFCKIFKSKYHCSPKQYKNKAGRPILAEL